jgi:hypothetical protein
MHVCILTDAGYKNFNPGMYLKEHTWEMVLVQSPALETIRSLAARNVFDVYLNLCDGFEAGDEDGDYTGLDVVKALGDLNLPFTGADSRSYDPSREHMQAVAERHQIGFVRGVNVSDVGEVEALTQGLSYPLMVKHPNSYGSMGMTRNSRVENLQELRTQVRRICNRFGSARVEEFVDGREFTAFVVDNPDDLGDPFVYPPAEITFPDGENFLHSHVKWTEYVYLKRVEEKKLAAQLKEMARRMYLAIGGVSYARCDIRMDVKGKLYMLEINPNNGILYKPEDLGPADIMMEYDAQGHDGFLERIFRSAVMRQRERSLSLKKTPGGD